MQAVDLPQAAADEIPRMRLADLGRHRKAQAVFRPLITEDIYHKAWPDRACSLAVNAAEVII